MKIANVFGDDSDSESETKNKPIQVCILNNEQLYFINDKYYQVLQKSNFIAVFYVSELYLTEIEITLRNLFKCT